MGQNTLNDGLGKLLLERCDELEEDAVAMARELAHLRNMIALVLAEIGNGDGKISKEQLEGLLNEKKCAED